MLTAAPWRPDPERSNPRAVRTLLRAPSAAIIQSARNVDRWPVTASTSSAVTARSSCSNEVRVVENRRSGPSARACSSSTASIAIWSQRSRSVGLIESVFAAFGRPDRSKSGASSDGAENTKRLSSRGKPAASSARSRPHSRKISMLRMVTSRPFGKSSVDGCRSTTVHSMPRRRRAMAMHKPTGPAPTIRTGVASVSVVRVITVGVSRTAETTVLGGPRGPSGESDANRDE